MCLNQKFQSVSSQQKIHQFQLMLFFWLSTLLKRNGAHLIWRKECLNKKDYPQYGFGWFRHAKGLLKHDFEFSSNFYHWHFASNGTFKKQNNHPNYCAPLGILLLQYDIVSRNEGGGGAM
jgi:hypothetical protein